MRGNSRCDDCTAPAHAAGGTSILKRTSSVKPIGPTREFYIRKSGGLIQRNICSIHRGGTFMKNLSRLDVICRLAFSMLLILPATLAAQQRPPIIEQIAKTYGIDSWDQVQAIRYTWNVDIPGLFKASHKWEWEPKTGKITFESTDKDGKPVKVTYDSSQLSSQSDQVKNQVEPAFVNDNYWLLFPFHAYWDTSAAVTDQGMKKLPMGTGFARLVSGKDPPATAGVPPTR